MILEKLMEKKDLKLYLQCRTRYLYAIRKKVVMFQEPRARDRINERFNGRIKEIKRLLKFLNDDKIKKMAKKDWENLAKEDEDDKRQ